MELFRTVFSVAFIGIVSAVFAISFAAIVYTGDLSAYLGQGIGMALMGCVVLAFVGAFVLSFKGSIVQIQDVPAILLAGATCTIIAQTQLSGDVLFATVACLTIVASFSVGIAAFLLAQFRLAMIARYIPYPVVAGFLAATGFLLFLGGIGVAVGTTPHVGNFSEFFAPDVFGKWAPSALAAVALLIAARAVDHQLTLPLGLLAITLVFYALIYLGDHSVSTAQSDGLLLGPFESGGFLDGLGPHLLMQADWGAVLSQMPVILTIVAISLIGATLNSSGLELELQKDFDVNVEVRGIGIANALASCVGSLPGYHLLGETILAHRLGMSGRLAGLSSAAGCLAILVLGASLLSVLPVGLFATVIAFLGLDLIFTWLWEARRQLRKTDYAIVVAIPVIAIAFSFLTAIAAGLAMAFVLFVVAYARLDVIRSQSTVAARRSLVERPDEQLDILSKDGHRARILDLSGYLFFGSSNVLRDRVQALLAEIPELRWLVLDFRHVSGVDISTWHVLSRLIGDCKNAGAELILSGLKDQQARAELSAFEADGGRLASSLDVAIEHIEQQLLDERLDKGGDEQLTGALATLLEQPEFAAQTETSLAEPGETVIATGQGADDIYVLLSGQLAVSLPNQQTGQSVTVAQIRPVSLVGEMAYYLGTERSADIVAETQSKVLRINMRSLDAMTENRPDLAAEFHRLIAKHMARRLRRTTQLVRDLGA